MGIYLNPGRAGFRESIQSQIYVDKTGMIEKVNIVLGTRQKYVCVSRPRRFGKSMAADMLAAYYGCEEDTDLLFQPFKISNSPQYRSHLNQHEVLKINVQEFLSLSHDVEEMLKLLQKRLLRELKKKYKEIVPEEENNLIFAMQDIYAETQRSFVILIDEWDCLFREYENEQ